MTRLFYSFPAYRLMALLLVGSLLAGCEGVQNQQPSDNGPVLTLQSYIRMAPTAPPPPQAETVPDPENVRTQVWRPGYWSWNGMTYDWVSGEMLARPDTTAVWSPDHWTEHTYGWAFIAGYWQ